MKMIARASARWSAKLRTKKTAKSTDPPVWATLTDVKALSPVPATQPTPTQHEDHPQESLAQRVSPPTPTTCILLSLPPEILYQILSHLKVLNTLNRDLSLYSVMRTSRQLSLLACRVHLANRVRLNYNTHLVSIAFLEIDEWWIASVAEMLKYERIDLRKICNERQRIREMRNDFKDRRLPWGWAQYSANGEKETTADKWAKFELHWRGKAETYGAEWPPRPEGGWFWEGWKDGEPQFGLMIM